MTVIAIRTSNICGNPIRGKRYVQLRIWLAARYNCVNFGQELAPSNIAKGRGKGRSYAYLWKTGMQRYGKRTYGSNVEVPISIPAHYHVVYERVHYVTPGKRKVSPARYINEVRTTRSTGEKIAFVNCHPVSKGYKRKGVSHAAWRAAQLRTYEHTLGLIVASCHRDGYTVVFGGDMNHPHFPAVAKGQVTLHHKGLDWLWALPAPGYRLAVVGRSTIPPTRFMDHPILTAQFALAKV